MDSFKPVGNKQHCLNANINTNINTGVNPCINISININPKIKHIIGVLPLKKILQSNLKQAIEKLIEIKIIKPQKYIYLSVAINDPETNRYLNFKYRNKSKTADILSFPTPPIPNPDINNLGDLAFDYQNIISQSKMLDIDEKKRFIQLSIHGLLHLCQFNHDSENQFKKMKTVEDYILAYIHCPSIEQ